MPTTLALRLSNEGADPVARERWRTRLQRVDGEPLPTASEEVTEPDRSNKRYSAAVRRLRALVYANPERSPLVRVEVSNYGFIRNLYGLKPLGVLLSIASLIYVIQMGFREEWTSHAIMVAVVSVALLAAWTIFVTPHEVFRSGSDYAERLFDALDQLV